MQQQEEAEEEVAEEVEEEVSFWTAILDAPPSLANGIGVRCGSSKEGNTRASTINRSTHPPIYTD